MLFRSSSTTDFDPAPCVPSPYSLPISLKSLPIISTKTLFSRELSTSFIADFGSNPEKSEISVLASEYKMLHIKSPIPVKSVKIFGHVQITISLVHMILSGPSEKQTVDSGEWTLGVSIVDDIVAVTGLEVEVGME